ncbi:hypothetical protein [Streptomyces cacaoi]|uniref:hypothetical protein n=1 Tax=Streptomyces cacaoi TaxID=1898 RepID=UPI00332D9D9A
MPSVDTTPLITAVERLADRLRALPQSRLTRGAAQEGLTLAQDLAYRAQRLEFAGGGPGGGEPRTLPDAGIFAVGDQLAVAGHDLAQALAGAPFAGAAGELEEALAEVRAADARIH